MKINLFEYARNGIPVQLYKTGNKAQDIKRMPEHVSLHLPLLAPFLLSMHKYSFRIYINLLNRLESSSKPVVVRQTILRNECTPNLRYRQTFEKYLNHLINQGLIFKAGTNAFYINPVYAYTAGSEACFNPDYIPTVKTEPPTAQEEPTTETSEPLRFYKTGKKAGMVKIPKRKRKPTV